jgi:hypothetical protein
METRFKEKRRIGFPTKTKCMKKTKRASPETKVVEGKDIVEEETTPLLHTPSKQKTVASVEETSGDTAEEASENVYQNTPTSSSASNSTNSNNGKCSSTSDSSSSDNSSSESSEDSSSSSDDDTDSSSGNSSGEDSKAIKEYKKKAGGIEKLYDILGQHWDMSLTLSCRGTRHVLKQHTYIYVKPIVKTVICRNREAHTTPLHQRGCEVPL